MIQRELHTVLLWPRLRMIHLATCMCIAASINFHIFSATFFLIFQLTPSPCGDSVENYRCYPDETEMTLSISRTHLRSIAAAELHSMRPFRGLRPPGYPVYFARHFFGALSSDFEMWLSEIPPAEGATPIPWSVESGATAAFNMVEVARSICAEINKRFSDMEREKIRNYMSNFPRR